jgi:hypothetical protein
MLDTAFLEQDNLPVRPNPSGTIPKARQKSGKTNGNGANLGFEEKLWAAADKLRGHMDAAEYKHVVLGLIFLKYIFEENMQRLTNTLAAQFKEGAKLEKAILKNLAGLDFCPEGNAMTRYAPVLALWFLPQPVAKIVSVSLCSSPLYNYPLLEEPT